MRWVAVLLLVATGSANVLFGWVTPWNLDCCFGEDDGQYMAIPTGVIHFAIAFLVALPRFGWVPPAVGVFGFALGFVWCLISALVWATWTVGVLLGLPELIIGGRPGPPVRPYDDLYLLVVLIPPAMLLAYAIAGWVLFPRVAAYYTGNDLREPSPVHDQ